MARGKENVQRGWGRVLAAGVLLLAMGGGAWGWLAKTPYPLMGDADIFAQSKALPDTAWQAESADLLVGDKGWKMALGALSIDGKGVFPLMVRTTKQSGGVPFRVIKDGDPKRSLTMTVTGEGWGASPLTLASGDTSGDLAVTWNIAADAPAMLRGSFRASFDNASSDIPFFLALLRSPDVFEIGFGVGSSEPSVYRSELYPDQSMPIDVPVICRPGDQLWVRVVNWGTNTLEASRTGMTLHRIFFDGGTAGAKYPFSAFGMVAKSDALATGDTTLAFAVPYAGGNRPSVNYPLALHVKNYSSLGHGASADGAALQPMKMVLPNGLPQLIPMEAATLSAEAVHPKYTPLVPNTFKAVTCDAPVFTIPPAGKFAALPLVVNWSFTSADLVRSGLLSAAQVEKFLNGVRGGGDVIRTVLKDVGVYKHFADRALDFRTLRPTTELTRYFEVGYNGVTVTLSFRVLLVDSPQKKVDVISDGGVGWFVIYDGTEDRRFTDPLCLAYTPFVGGITPTPLPPTPTPTPGPGTPTVTPVPSQAQDEGSKSGCSLGGVPGALLLLLPLGLVWGRR